jgi:hypothetical protein
MSLLGLFLTKGETLAVLSASLLSFLFLHIITKPAEIIAIPQISIIKAFKVWFLLFGAVSLSF